MRPKSLSLLLLLFLLPISLAAQSPQEKVWLGVSVEEADEGGPVTLVEVVPGSPAAKAGLKVGDAVLQVGRAKVKNLDGFMESVLAMSPGSTQSFAIRRKGKTLRLRVKLGSQAEREALARKKARPKRVQRNRVAKKVKKTKPRATKPRGKGRLGVTLEDDGMSIRVLEVVKGGPAAKAGLQRRDLIVKARGREVRDLDEFIADIQKTGAGAAYPLEIRRGNQTLKLTARLGGYGRQPAEPGRMGGPAVAKKDAPKKKATPKKHNQRHASGAKGNRSPLIGRVVAQAKKQGRLALILFFDPESEASKLTSKSLADPRVKKILKAGYVGTKVNVLQQGRLADRHGVMATPHFQVLDGEGKTIGKFTGYQPPERLAARLQRYLYANRSRVAVKGKPTSRRVGKKKDQPRRVAAKPSAANLAQQNQRILRQMQNERRRMEKLLKEMKQLEQRLKKLK